MQKFVLLCLLFISSLNITHAKELPDFTGLVEEYGEAVVNISTVQTQQIAGGQIFPEIPNLPEDSPFFEFFRRYMQPFSGPRKYESKSLGSGFIISKDGYILTNAHVVESANEITVKLNDKREFSAEVIGTDRKTDVALIKIDAKNLPVVTQGDPDRLKVGEWVVAIGSPFGFENSVTAGIVSAKGRSLAQENYVPFIQTDVAINPGNSGGPLFNMRGEVVGINSQIYSRTGGFMGLSFAIPINVATDIANQLKAHGKVSRGKIGVMIQEMTEELAESFGLSKAQGALVVSVEKDGPADKAGIEIRDVILKFGDKAIEVSSDLPRIVGNTKPNTKVPVQVWRNGTTKNIAVIIGEMPSEEGERSRKQGKKIPDTSNRLGLALSELADGQKKQLGIEGGLLVEEVQHAGVAARAGIRQGDIILGFNNQDIKTIRQFNQLLEKVEKGRNIALLIKRGDMTTFITMKLER
ncbi:MAG TPA: DegQ family serine endoprotease [Nitrosomonas nitrosa]|jgi:serine protease Do|uniref:Probable periplasmic serine endoprotease DegP-like n=1 Tax=Nitrosomonas nitrosa TaxID=52442 RepID=A0A1I4PQB2_9PROT|nr:DegQ family serine endoprotease [Nitrosomonas nitrosa]MCO6434331.1 DegQ family serine endoprotease [Nitrosomonas nitrosa]PTR03495.1 serine protease Do [Nitrosomonas nitrosa]CAE6502353.1 putative periplasmic serine endoprotease DegP-like [Nitrosomonas nitrosa]SFM30081.1 serine protease Do [Nitrosomonas nitrosa]HBZ29708.1 DegQ family serine endoprotease [Nitrosomonas nitrosa]